MVDFCPSVEPSYPATLCSSPSSQQNYDDVSGRGMVYARGSLCLSTTLRTTGSAPNSPSVGCYRAVCVSPTTMQLAAYNAGGALVNATGRCTTGGQLVWVPGLAGNLTCPEVASYCGVQLKTGACIKPILINAFCDGRPSCSPVGYDPWLCPLA